MAAIPGISRQFLQSFADFCRNLHVWRGLKPGCCFSYSCPAIRVLAITMTARIFGIELGISRPTGTIFMSAIIGL
jgi:uncharacterized membrane protein YraQ (UPF0718 family)